MLTGAASQKLIYLLKSVQKTHKLLYGCERWTMLMCRPGFIASQPREIRSKLSAPRPVASLRV